MKVSIIDYKMGNIYSVSSALFYLGIESNLTDVEDEILSSDKIILPGVGSFNKAMSYLNESGLSDIIKIAALGKKIPLLGICLGMQLLCENGKEDGSIDGLKLIKGSIDKFPTSTSAKIPHVGFSPINIIGDNPLFNGLNIESDFYFTHSYRLKNSDPSERIGMCSNEEIFTAAVCKNNVYGTQFHPEKSQSNGLIVLKNFMEL